MRKIFTVIISDKEYDVYDIPNKEHSGLNDTVKTWWLYYADRLPDGITPPLDSSDFEPWCVSINRMVWDIRFKQRNYSKEKWGDTDFRNTTIVEMHCNNRLVYSFSTAGERSGLSFAMAKVQYLQVLLAEHPYNFFEPESENGRKICFHGLPATVRVRIDGWEIDIIPDLTDMNKADWWREYRRRTKKITAPDDWDAIEDDHLQENEESGYINWGDALSDGNIYWFRK